MSTISEFVRRYVREQDFYTRVAELCGRRLERLLHDNNVRAITTWRAKRPDRLQKKLEERERTRIATNIGPYKQDDDIYDDIPDLAGTRIALYFPGDRERVRLAIQKIFTMVREPRIFPRAEDQLSSTEKERRQGKRFAGYTAEHFRVRLRESELSTDEKKYAEGRCEIQVASVLMHAWAEVEHDLEYKTLSGKVSETESAILDQINGLVIAGEMALEQLQLAAYRRSTFDGDGGFRDQYDLATWLTGISDDMHRRGLISARPSIGRADLAFRVIEIAKVPQVELNRFRTEQIAHPDERNDIPMAQRLIESLLAGNGERETALQRAKVELAAEESDSAPAAVTTSTLEYLALGQFLLAWRNLEDMLRRNARLIGLRHSAGIMRLIRDVDISAKDREDLLRLNDIKNRAVHATSEAPTANELIAATEILNKTSKNVALRLVASASPDNNQSPNNEDPNEYTLRQLRKSGLDVTLSSAYLLPAEGRVMVIMNTNNNFSVPYIITDARLIVDGIEHLPTIPTEKELLSDDIGSAYHPSQTMFELQNMRNTIFYFGRGVKDAPPIVPASGTTSVNFALSLTNTLSLTNIETFRFDLTLKRVPGE